MRKKKYFLSPPLLAFCKILIAMIYCFHRINREEKDFEIQNTVEPYYVEVRFCSCSFIFRCFYFRQLIYLCWLISTWNKTFREQYYKTCKTKIEEKISFVRWWIIVFQGIVYICLYSLGSVPAPNKGWRIKFDTFMFSTAVLQNTKLLNLRMTILKYY